MDKTIKTGFKLIGLKLDKKTTNKGGQSSIDCGNLWQRIEKEHWIEKIPGKLNNDLYAVYYDYEGDHTLPFSYFIGCQVTSDTELAPGLHALFIPEHKYVKVSAKGRMPDCLINAWKSIWSSKIDRAYHYDFEIYDERSKDWSNAEVEIFVSCNDEAV